MNGVENAHHPLQLIRCKTKINRDLVHRDPAALLVVGLNNLCSHLLLIMWFWLFENQLKTARTDMVMMVGFRR